MTSLCDDREDCHLGEDEYLCNVYGTCPNYCICIMYAIFCNNGYLHGIFNENIVFTKLVNVTVTPENDNYLIWMGSEAVICIWIDSHLSDICSLTNTTSTTLQLFDTSFNNIQAIKNYCFYGLENLGFLSLSNNKLIHISFLAFSGLEKILKLDLSVNHLFQLTHNSFKHLKCTSLNLSYNNLKTINIHKSTFANIDQMLTRDYRLCCLLKSSDTLCHIKPQWPQSCNVMLNSMVSKLITTAESMLILALNLMNIILILTFSTYDKSIYILNIFFLNANDMLFGVYLLCILIADHYYGNKYVVYAAQWLQSIYCQSLGLHICFSHAQFSVFTQYNGHK